jgi:etoposide-induced 2.4 mRNA
MLNALSLVSIYAFDLFLHPLVRGQQNWLNRNLGWIYQALWLIPLVGVSFYLNVCPSASPHVSFMAEHDPQSSWCSIIANRTFALQHGNRIQAQPVTYSSFITTLATSAYRVVMILTSVVLSFALRRLPVAGPFVGFLFVCWFDS